MTIEDDIAYLERIPLLRQLGSGALRIVAIGVESYDLQPGQILFAAGNSADGAYIIQRGSVSLKPERAANLKSLPAPAPCSANRPCWQKRGDRRPPPRARAQPSCASRARCFCECSKAIRTPRTGCAR